MHVNDMLKLVRQQLLLYAIQIIISISIGLISLLMNITCAIGVHSLSLMMETKHQNKLF